MKEQGKTVALKNTATRKEEPALNTHIDKISVQPKSSAHK